MAGERRRSGAGEDQDRQGDAGDLVADKGLHIGEPDGAKLGDPQNVGVRGAPNSATHGGSHVSHCRVCPVMPPFAVVAIVSSEGIDSVPGSQSVICGPYGLRATISRDHVGPGSIGRLRIIRRSWDRARGQPAVRSGPVRPPGNDLRRRRRRPRRRSGAPRPRRCPCCSHKALGARCDLPAERCQPRRGTVGRR